MELNGVPLHPLVVHAVVVLGPLAALAGLAYAVVPRWRWLLRWPLVVLAVVTAVAAFVAVQAGEALLDLRPELEPLVEEHEERGELLRNVALGYAVVSLLAAWALGGASALASGRGARETRLGIPVMVLLAVGAVALAVCLFLAGDSGSRAVWG
jgi:MFS family permease